MLILVWAAVAGLSWSVQPASAALTTAQVDIEALLAFKAAALDVSPRGLLMMGCRWTKHV